MEIPEDIKAQMIRELASSSRIVGGAGANIGVNDVKEESSPCDSLESKISITNQAPVSGGLHACPSCNLSLDSLLESKLPSNFCPSCGSKLEGHKDPGQMSWKEMLETSLSNKAKEEQEITQSIEEIRKEAREKLLNNYGVRKDLIESILQ